VPPRSIFCDFNGTITARDTLAALLEHFGRDDVMRAVERGRRSGSLTLRKRIAMQAARLTCTLGEAADAIERDVGFDETFGGFYRRCRAEHVLLVVLSSGITELIREVLARHHLPMVPVIANGSVRTASGWRVIFRDDTPYGNAKGPYVAEAQSEGRTALVIGDDESDFDAAMMADRCFAKRGSELERYLRERNLPYEGFATFAEIEAMLFSEPFEARG
jgi:2-hydroxy-3-keto-5-methylthiopentenyl-1-phosphate phosphatase